MKILKYALALLILSLVGVSNSFGMKEVSKKSEENFDFEDFLKHLKMEDKER